MGCNSSVLPSGKENSGSAPSHVQSTLLSEVHHGSSFEEKKDGEAEVEILNSGLEFIKAKDNTSNIFAAIKKGDLQTVSLLIKSVSSVNTMIGMWGSTPLIVSIQYGFKDIALLLFSQGNVDTIINHRNDKGGCALLYACMDGNMELVKLLLTSQATIDVPPSQEPIYNTPTDQSLICTPFSIACYNGHAEVVGVLLDKEPFLLNRPFSFTVLKSIQKQMSESEKGVPAKVPGALSVTPIALATAMGQLSVVKELLLRQWDCTVTDSDQSTLLHHVARAKQQNIDILHTLKLHPSGQILLKDAAWIDRKDVMGDTALHIACEHKQEEVVQFLLEEGCSVTVRNGITGLTPLHIAVKRRQLECVELLLDHGADPLIEDHSKTSPMMLAEKLRKDSEIYLLMDKAATAFRAIRSVSSNNNSNAAANRTVYSAHEQLLIDQLKSPRMAAAIIEMNEDDAVRDFSYLDASYDVAIQPAETTSGKRITAAAKGSAPHTPVKQKSSRASSRNTLLCPGSPVKGLMSPSESDNEGGGGSFGGGAAAGRPQMEPKPPSNVASAEYLSANNSVGGSAKVPAPPSSTKSSSFQRKYTTISSQQKVSSPYDSSKEKEKAEEVLPRVGNSTPGAVSLYSAGPMTVSAGPPRASTSPVKQRNTVLVARGNNSNAMETGGGGSTKSPSKRYTNIVLPSTTSPMSDDEDIGFATEGAASSSMTAAAPIQPVKPAQLLAASLEAGKAKKASMLSPAQAPKDDSSINAATATAASSALQPRAPAGTPNTASTKKKTRDGVPRPDYSRRSRRRGCSCLANSQQESQTIGLSKTSSD